MKFPPENLFCVGERSGAANDSSTENAGIFHNRIVASRKRVYADFVMIP